MAKPIRTEYLATASQLERSFLLAYDKGFPASQAKWEKIYREFDYLKALYKRAARTLVGRDLQAITKAHAQVKFLFPPQKKGESWEYDADAKQLHYLRIALEHDLAKLVPKYFTQLTYESQSLAFELLCSAFGHPTGKTSTDGMIHIASNPRNLLAPVFSVEKAPRIIDVMLQGKTPTATLRDQQETRPQPTLQTFGMDQFLSACQEIKNSHVLKV